jgi:DNA-directed RNA polymerase subunit L|tara:strand:- start:5572 stop:5847 length:276 start_codon:yes stop_codon:yes gene_type:complete
LQVKINKKKLRVKIEIEDEDIALGQILRKELIEDKETAFAGVVKPHPLINKFNIQVETKKEDPIQQVIKSGNTATKIVNELSEKINKSTKK